jgi:hypothetical protein
MQLFHPLFLKLRELGQPILYRSKTVSDWQFLEQHHYNNTFLKALAEGFEWRPASYTFMQAISLIKKGVSFRRECWSADMVLSVAYASARIRVASIGMDGSKKVAYSDFLDVNDYEATDWIPTSFNFDFDQEPKDA